MQITCGGLLTPHIFEWTTPRNRTFDVRFRGLSTAPGTLYKGVCVML